MSYEKMIKQVQNDPLKMAKVQKFNLTKKRKFGKITHRCRRCRKSRGVITNWGLNYCRQCFREEAEKLGFRKYS